MAVSPGLARRIDRLARRAHAFHRFAHHPLCGRYRGELIALGARARICRGCTLTLTAALFGVLGASLFALPVLPLALVSLACLATSFGQLARAADAARMRVGFGAPERRRVGKLWTRAVPACLLGATWAESLREPTAPHLALASGLALASAAWLWGYRRRGPDRSPCLSCPEYASSQPCSGFREIVRAERAFTRRAQQLLDAAPRSRAPSP